MNDMNDAPEMTPDIEADAVPEAAEANHAELLDAKDKEIAELKDRLLRQAAETENTRRRLERDKADTAAYAMTGFARDLLAVADNLRRAVAALPAEGFDAVRSGIEATERELTAIFGRHGITKVETAGQKLDPNRHQAMIEVEHETHAPGAIVDELQAGYVIKDRLLRPALVSVAKAKA
ncbi:nucleotide exchange factor GrpE [Polymorphobacter fuscus]|uniref:Protein GrpE n=1 Tax=Sandarakinorhabdus fusca TaxID=1439888 RepID=A0A7C9KXI1_9SPHN|nr:nucleotide exchange factor GrpE [Polymorphobacter fuscus]KAB7645476.1 nucleotide exchange factor GrpE [Polymorphobacter fuscus]MQT17905.1 nucleotide exchange factor GrpE [Polymorphobacter fuscus]NJC08535.1 molecular chaperone GrpE [Polymorphobacter fuscus]